MRKSVSLAPRCLVALLLILGSCSETGDNYRGGAKSNSTQNQGSFGPGVGGPGSKIRSGSAGDSGDVQAAFGLYSPAIGERKPSLAPTRTSITCDIRNPVNRLWLTGP